MIWLTTYLPNHTPTHVWGSLHRFQIFKQNQIIFIGWSVIEFLLILGVPQGMGWVDWFRGGCRCWGAPHADMHMHVKYDKHGCLHEGGHLQFLYMYMCAYAYMHMHVHMCVDTPHAPRCTPIICPSPQELQGGQNTKNSLSLELIEIIWFCLKILYLWTLLNSYRL